MQIHELNNFSGTLGAGSYLAIDNGTDTGRISSQGLLASTEARIDTANDQIADVKSALRHYFGSKGTVPSNIDHFLETGWYRITPSYQTVTLPDNLTGITHTLIVIAPASPVSAGLQFLVSASGVVYSRYVFADESTSPSTWTQYAIQDDINNLKSFIDSQIEIFLSLTTSNIVTPTYTTGEFIDYAGAIQDNADTQISNAIELKAGNTITLYARGYLDRVSMIAECDASGNYISGKVRSIDSAFHIYTYTPLYDCYVRVSGYTRDMKIYITEKEEYFDYIENLLDLSEVYTPTDITWSDGFIAYNGTEYTGTDGACKKSSLINLKAGYTIRVNAHYSGTNVAIIAKYYNGTFIPLVISDTNINTYEYTASEDMQVCVSGRAKADYISRSVIIYRKTKNAPSLDFINLSMFEKFGVVGDSFASGALMTDPNTGEAHYNLSWGQVLARNLGTECINFSEGGLTTKTWLTSAKGLPLLLSSDAQDIYYLALGINDAYHLSNEPIVPLGTISDIKADYRQNPDSFYGNYGRIIDQIKAKAPKAKLVMFTVATYSNATYSSPNKTSISNAIKEIASHYSIPVIEQDADWFFRSDFYLNNMVFSHPTAPLYSGMANAFKRMIESVIHDNYSYFADYGY